MGFGSVPGQVREGAHQDAPAATRAALTDAARRAFGRDPAAACMHVRLHSARCVVLRVMQCFESLGGMAALAHRRTAPTAAQPQPGRWGMAAAAAACGALTSPSPLDSLCAPSVKWFSLTIGMILPTSSRSTHKAHETPARRWQRARERAWARGPVQQAGSSGAGGWHGLPHSCCRDSCFAVRSWGLLARLLMAWGHRLAAGAAGLPGASPCQSVRL